ncbi:MAG: helix-turn-helix transcriptional regulator [Proteobacteria bacterium]|nr:helix-turn-helix transcriptional regulator [Pseudomonadota bacterium]
MTTQGDRLRALARAAGFSSLADFARSVGLEPGTARQQANRNSIPADALGKYIAKAKGTGATMEWLASGIGPPPKNVALPAEEFAPKVQVTREVPPPKRPDVPVWASAQAGKDGAMILVPDPIDYIYRSERMLDVKNPFAFAVEGDSMSPAIEHGDQVVINPALKPRPNVDCVFIRQREDGSYLALVKRLLRVTEPVWKVRQFEPKRDFDLSRKEWPQIHVIAEIRRGGL